MVNEREYAEIIWKDKPVDLEENPVSELLNSILDTINTHELFQKDSLEVHLGRLDRVEEDLLTVLEKMEMA